MVKKQLSAPIILLALCLAFCIAFSGCSANKTPTSSNAKETESAEDLQLHQYNQNRSIFDYDADYMIELGNYQIDHEKGTKSIDIILTDRQTGERKTIKQCSAVSQVCLHGGNVFYNDEENHCIKQCNFKGKKEKTVYTYDISDNQDSLTVRTCNFIFAEEKMIVALWDGESQAQELYFLDISTGKTELITQAADFNFYSYNGKLYYFNNGELFTVDLDTGRTVDKQPIADGCENFNFDMLNMDKNHIYYCVEKQMQDDETPYEIYSYDVESQTKELVEQFKTKVPMHDGYCDGQSLYFLCGTGDGCGFGIVENGVDTYPESGDSHYCWKGEETGDPLFICDGVLRAGNYKLKSNTLCGVEDIYTLPE